MEQKKTARIGIIGAGGIANNVHLPSLSEIDEAELVAVCDLRLEKAKAASEKYNIPGVYWDMYEMLAKEKLDGVMVLVEPDRLFRAAEDVMRAGVHVYMEKPAGITAHQANALARVSKEKNRICQVGMNRRHIPLVKEVARKMNAVTKVNQVNGVFMKYTDLAHAWLYASAFTTDIVHAIDLVRHLAGSEVEAAATVVGRFNDSPVDNAWSSIMRFQNGITGTIHSSYQAGGRVHNFEMHGPGASAFINLGFGGEECEADILYYKGASMYSMAAAGIGDKDREHIDGRELAGTNAHHAVFGYKQEDIAFVDALLGKAEPQCVIEDAAHTMELVETLLKNTI